LAKRSQPSLREPHFPLLLDVLLTEPERVLARVLLSVKMDNESIALGCLWEIAPFSGPAAPEVVKALVQHKLLALGAVSDAKSASQEQDDAGCETGHR
jgi:hypothetical protein